MTILKDYQQRVIDTIETFFEDLDNAKQAYENNPALQSLGDYLRFALGSAKYAHFPDRPSTGAGKPYPRVCIKMPTGGGKTLVAVEAIRSYQNLFAKRKTGIVVWITHREQIYRQTTQNLQNKNHPYRQFLDQASGNRTVVLEKGQPMRLQDVQENLVVLMLMIQSARRDTNKIFEDSGGYADFFPPENRYDLQKAMAEAVPNLDKTPATLFEQSQIKTSLGNVIRTLQPLLIVDEFHTMFTDNARRTLDGLNPSAILGLSATPKSGMNILASISGKDLKAAEMIKLDMHLIPPAQNGEWRGMLAALKSKRESLEKKAHAFEQNKGIYIRPIALIQVERTGKDQRGQGFVHSEDVREFLIDEGVPRHEIAVKSSSLDEIKAEKLLSKESEIRYIITKEALKEGWDCSFAYLLGVIPNARNNNSMTQLVGRILRQPYAKKTGVPELDESYVFFGTGHTQEVLELVKKGFEDEGLGDVVTSGIERQDAHGTAVNPPQVVNIKKEIQKEHPESLFLPVWLVKEDGRYRKFSYETDIEAQIDWSALDIPGIVKEIAPTIGTRRNVQQDVLVDLVEGKVELREAEASEPISFDTLYLARRFFETICNAFIAQDIAKAIFAALARQAKQELLDQDAGYIAAECEKRLIAYKRGQESAIFEKHLISNQLTLAVSDDEKIGFGMPQRDTIPDGIRAPYNFSLYDGVDTSSLDTLERSVVRIIEDSTNVLWWARNKAEKGWYAVQGWQKNKIRPDFIIARKNSDDRLEFVYVVESKGEQLAGNPDTEYKNSVFGKMNDMRGEVQTISAKTTTVHLNDRFEFELVPQGSEEMKLREKLNEKMPTRT